MVNIFKRFWACCVAFSHPVLGVGYVYALIATLFSTGTVVISYLQDTEIIQLSDGSSWLKKSALLTYQHRYVIILVCTLVLASWIYIFFKSHFRKKEARGPKSRDFFLLYAKYLDEMNQILGIKYNDSSNSTSGALSPESQVRLESAYGHLVKRSLSLINNVFSKYTGNQCHVSLKLFHKDNEEIQRFVRDDTNTARSRTDDINKCFPAKQDTAFSQILYDENCKYYLRNKIKYTHKSNKFSNNGNTVGKYFDSVICVPITLCNNTTIINKDSVIAFLCVDNFGGGFDKSCIYILFSFAHCLYVVLDLMGRIDPFSSLSHTGARSDESAPRRAG